MLNLRRALRTVARIFNPLSWFRPARQGDYMLRVLQGIAVRDALNGRPAPTTVPAAMPFKQVLEIVKQSSANVFPIVDERGYLVGVFSLSDIRQIMNERAVGRLIVAGDLGATDTTAVTLDTKLDEALNLLTRRNADEIPVVQTERPDEDASHSRISKVMTVPRGPVGTARVIGMLSYRDLIAAYQNEIRRREIEGSSPRIEPDTPAPKKPFPPAASAGNPGVDLLEDPPEQFGDRANSAS